MDAYGGFIFISSSEEETETLTRYIRNYRSCSVAMNNPALQFGVIELCLFSLDRRSISYVVLMRKAREIVSGRYCLKFLKFVEIHPISLHDLELIFHTHFFHKELFPLKTENLDTHIISTANSVGKRLQANVWRPMIDLLRNYSSEQAKNLDELERIRQLSHQRLTSVGINILKQEKDATLLALKLFGVDYDNILTSWFTQHEQSGIYLQGLEGYHKAREDDTIINDILQSVSQIAGTPLQNLQASIKGLVRVPRNNGQTITIVNANRNKLEDTTGADLVYYNHTYRSHLMVQYKMMDIDIKEEAKLEPISSSRRRASNSKISQKEKFGYRPDKKFTEQVERMKKLQALAVEAEDTNDTLGYRLNNNSFFFKLCESFEFEPMSSDLAHGLYLPLDYMEQLLQSPKTTGPQGGKIITYENAGRHFSNTLFMDLMKEGLIGSSPNASKLIYEEIHNSLSDGRSLTLAWEAL